MLPLDLARQERETLERWVRRRKTAQALAQRARIVLACAGGQSNGVVAVSERVTRQTVGRWRARFVAKRLDGLLDEPRPGAPRRITDADVERALTRTLESTPREATHWSTRALARACGLSQSAVSRIWRAFALQPHRTETFKLSHDPLFIEKVRDIVGLYLHPPDKALVLCVDEKTQIQALDRSQPLLPMRPGQPERRAHGLCAPRHHLSVRRAQHQERGRAGAVPSSPSGPRVPQVPGADRRGGSRPVRGPPHPGQLRYPQSAPDSPLVGSTSALPSSFHSDRGLLDQPSRTLVRHADRETDSAWDPSQHPRIGGRHRCLHPSS